MNPNDKRNYEIVWQSCMKAAIELVPENKKGTEEGYKLYKDYHKRIFGSYCEWKNKMNKQ
jgi:hypothetical protein